MLNLRDRQGGYLVDRQESNSSVRRYIAYVSTLGTTRLHLRNPFVIAWWSIAIPGLVHLLLSKLSQKPLWGISFGGNI